MILYTNADGLLNKKDELLLQTDKMKPKIIAITETVPKNISDFVLSEYKLEIFEIFHNENPKRGVALYIDRTLQAQACDTLNKCTFREAIWCQFQTEAKEKVLVGCIYKSPNTTEDNLKELYRLFQKEEIQNYDKVCIMGDFNFPDMNWE